jgi:hypothetical protein
MPSGGAGSIGTLRAKQAPHAFVLGDRNTNAAGRGPIEGGWGTGVFAPFNINTHTSHSTNTPHTLLGRPRHKSKPARHNCYSTSTVANAVSNSCAES